MMNRRSCLAIFPTLTLFELHALASPKFGSAEWMRRFKVFMKACNEFIMALDDDKLDYRKWEDMRVAWHHLETD